MLHQFGLRSGSAGVGKWHGGEGAVREIEFLEPMQVSILSEVSCLFELYTISLVLNLFSSSDGRGNHMDWKAVDLVHWAAIPGSSNVERKTAILSKTAAYSLAKLTLVVRLQYGWVKVTGF